MVLVIIQVKSRFKMGTKLVRLKETNLPAKPPGLCLASAERKTFHGKKNMSHQGLPNQITVLFACLSAGLASLAVAETGQLHFSVL